MDDYTEKERLEVKITALESALTHQTELLERQEQREKKRRIWFFIKCAIVVVALAVLIPRGVAFVQEVEAFAEQTESQIAAIQEETTAFLEDADEKLETASEVMESLKTIITPLEEFAAKWQTFWR